MMKKAVSVVLVSLSMVLGGCATKSSIEKRGFFSEKLSWPSEELSFAPNNPAVIANIRPLASGTNAAGYAGSRLGDIGRFGGGGDLPSAVVALGAGVVAAGVGAIAGMFMDAKAQVEAQKRPDLYEVILETAYALDPSKPLPLSEKDMVGLKRHGAQIKKSYIVQFDRKDVNYQDHDVVVIKETKEKVAGRRIYRAIDIFDAQPGDTHSKQFLVRMQDIARKAGVNKRIEAAPAETTAVAQPAAASLAN